MRAMILAAGRGERMRPLTDTQPKPLLKAGGHSLIEWHIRRLVEAGITQLVINHAWLGKQIEDQIGDGRRYGANIAYSAEDTALETAGGIARALPLLGKEPFLVINGDVWCDWDPRNASDATSLILSRNLQAWLLLTSNPSHHPDGDFSLDDDGLLYTTSGVESFTFTGIGVYRPEFFSTVQSGTAAPLAPLLYQGIEMRQIAGEYYNGLWVDVGTPQRLASLDAMLSTGPHL